MRAATDRILKNGEYVGPTKIGGFRGLPKLLTSSEKSYNENDAQKLWEMSEQLTGVKYLISPMVNKLFYPHDRAAATS